MSANMNENKPASSNRRRAVQWSVIIAVSLVAAAAWTLANIDLPSASAQAVQAGGEPAGMFAVAGQITPDTYGLYVVDPKRGSVVVYEYVPARRQLHLRAARSIVYDLQLESYNTAPDPAEVADMVRRARTISDTNAKPASN